MENLSEIVAKYYSAQGYLSKFYHFISHRKDTEGNIIELEINDGEYEDFPFIDRLGEFIGEFKKLKSLTIEIDPQTIDNLEALSELHDLEHICIDCLTEVTDLEFTKSMRNLRYLFLLSSQINDISILSDKKELETLFLGDANIDDISVLSNLSKLKSVGLSNNQIKNIDHLRHCKMLISLGLSNNQIENVDSLRYCLELRSIDFQNNNIQNIDALKELSHLSEVNLSNNKIQDCSSFYDLKKIRILRLSNNKIRSIAPIKNCQELLHLFIDNNLIEDISSLEHKYKLKFLNISNNPITSIEALKDLKLLNRLEAGNLSELSIGHSFAFQAQLTYVDFGYCNLRDISFLCNQRKIKQLKINNNPIVDYTCLLNFHELIELNVRNNNIQNYIPTLYPLNRHSYNRIRSIDLRDNPFGNAFFTHINVPGYTYGRSSFYETEEKELSEIKKTFRELEKIIADVYLAKGKLEEALAYYYLDEVYHVYSRGVLYLNIRIFYLKHLSNRNSPLVYYFSKSTLYRSSYFSSKNEEEQSHYRDLIKNIKYRTVHKPKEKMRTANSHLNLEVKHNSLEKYQDIFKEKIEELLNEERELFKDNIIIPKEPDNTFMTWPQTLGCLMTILPLFIFILQLLLGLPEWTIGIALIMGMLGFLITKFTE